MDATRPHALGNAGRRFYVICEADRSFRAMSSGHGGGRRLNGIANFANGKRCARNFGNAMGSRLTTGGAYVTSEQITSFKGYYPVSGGRHAALVRSFVQFDGEGETANARPREIGGHAAVLLRGMCLRKRPDSPYADPKGYVPFGTVENYSDGRSSGCTSWSPADAEQIIPMMKDKPATLYIYPEFDRHRRHRTNGEGGPVAVGRRIVLERLLFERNPLSQVLAKGNPRADHRAIREGSSGTAAAANSDLQDAVKLVTCAWPRMWRALLARRQLSLLNAREAPALRGETPGPALVGGSGRGTGEYPRRARSVGGQARAQS